MKTTWLNTDVARNIWSALISTIGFGVSGSATLAPHSTVPPLVGQPVGTLISETLSSEELELRLLAMCGPTPIPLLSCQAQRFIQWTTCWKSSSLPDPNIHLVCKFSPEELAFAHGQGKSASALRESVFNSIAHLYRREFYAWLCVWTMESHHGIHVHALLWAPEGRTFRNLLAALLIRRFEVPRDRSVTPWGQLTKQNTGAPVCIVSISEHRLFRRVDKRGLDGVIDYVAKDIDRNVASPIVSRRLGKIAGATKLILDIRKPSALARPRVRKVPLSPAGGARS